MNLENILIILSSLFLVVSSLPYLIEVVRGVAKPKVASWFVWSTLTFIGFAAALVDKQYPTAILLFIETIACASIVVLGWKKGDKKIDRLDIICLIGAGVGLVLWWMFNSPAIAVIASVVIDSVGAVPTVIHSWKRPGEEVWLTFALSFAGSLFTLLAIRDWRITSVAYPIYLVALNALISVIIISRGWLVNKRNFLRQAR